MVEPHSSNFRVHNKFLGVRIFKKFTVERGYFILKQTTSHFVIYAFCLHIWQDVVFKSCYHNDPKFSDREEQSDQGLHCLQCRLHPLDAILYSKATLFKF